MGLFFALQIFIKRSDMLLYKITGNQNKTGELPAFSSILNFIQINFFLKFPQPDGIT